MAKDRKCRFQLAGYRFSIKKVENVKKNKIEREFAWMCICVSILFSVHWFVKTFVQWMTYNWNWLEPITYLAAFFGLLKLK